MRAKRVAFSVFVILHVMAGMAWSADEAVMPLEPRAKALPTVVLVQERVYRAAEHQARYLLTLVHPWEGDPDLLLITASRSGEHFIRPNTGMIEGLAFLYRFGPYDERLVGISRRDLLDKVLLPMMRYCMLTHVTGDRVTSDGERWGNHWQSAHRAQMLGNAAFDHPDTPNAGGGSVKYLDRGAFEYIPSRGTAARPLSFRAAGTKLTLFELARSA